jgi:hypothetical protein
MPRLQPQSGDIPAAFPTPLTQPFWDGCRRGELLYQFFPGSGVAQFNPAPIDRVSLSDEFEWRVSAGHGSVYSWSVVWRPQTPAFSVPYCAAIVDLDEGFQMVSNIIGCDADAVHCGQRVQVDFVAVRDDLTLPYFRPVDG